MRKEITPEQRNERRKRLMYRRTGAIYKKTALVFLLFLVLANVFNLAGKDKAYSLSENRMLAQKPEFTMSSLTSGKYMKDMEEYVTDQFFIRDKWISLNVMEELAMGRRESNGVYIGKNHQLMEKPSDPDQKALDQNLEAIHDFAAGQSGVNTVMALVPNAAYICTQNLPKNAPVRNQAEDISYVKNAVGDALSFVELEPVMAAHKEEYIYYKTDHHWTTLGARYAFEAMTDALKLGSTAADYEVYPVTHSFSGTLASKSGYDLAQDTIEIYVPDGVSSDCVVTYIDENRKSSSVYYSKALETKDKYEVFFGGNHTRIDIATPIKEKKNLLLFKDSYANCLIPFLIPYYRNIIVIDPRYYYDDISKAIADNEITDILFLYNVDTFLSDHSLHDVLVQES